MTRRRWPAGITREVDHRSKVVKIGLSMIGFFYTTDAGDNTSNAYERMNSVPVVFYQKIGMRPPATLSQPFGLLNRLRKISLTTCRISVWPFDYMVKARQAARPEIQR